MEKIGKFNDLSEGLKSKLPVLEPGQVVTYEWLIFDKDHLTDRPLYGAARSLRGRDRIKDGKNFIDIGLPKIVEGDKVKKCQKFVVDGGGANGSVGARFDLHGDSIEEMQWHQFFSICNYNTSNPNADVNTTKLIRLVDPGAEAKERTKKRSVLRDALVLHEDMKAEDIRMVAASLNWDSADDIQVLRDKIGDYAMKSPAEFIERISNAETKNKAELRLAFDKGVIAYDPAKHQVKWGESGTVIASLDRVEGKDYLETLNEYLATSKNGGTIVTAIRKKVSAAIVTATKGKSDTPE